MPAGPVGSNSFIKWLFSELNSVEAASLPWDIIQLTGDDQDVPIAVRSADFWRHN
jgi:hypothetical protein